MYSTHGPVRETDWSTNSVDRFASDDGSICGAEFCDHLSGNGRSDILPRSD